VRTLEDYGREKRTACFVIMNGKASGSAWWSDDLRWEDLSKPEYEALVEELKADDVNILALDICEATSKTTGVSGWDWRIGEESETPEGNSDEAPELT